MLLPSGNPFKCHEEVLYFQLLIPPKRFDIFFPQTGGCSEGLGAFRFFFKNISLSTRFLLHKKRYEIFDGTIFARQSCRKNSDFFCVQDFVPIRTALKRFLSPKYFLGPPTQIILEKTSRKKRRKSTEFASG